jgi:hypothetical protein
MRPVWSFEIVRDTDAPFGVVRRALLDGGGYGSWSPRHAKAEMEVAEDGACLEVLRRARSLGAREDAAYRVEPMGGRLLLTYRGRFRGWTAILFMGWWRMRSERVWERFVASLPPQPPLPPGGA